MSCYAYVLTKPIDSLTKKGVSVDRSGMEGPPAHITIPHTAYEPGKYFSTVYRVRGELTVIPGSHLVNE